MCIRDRIRAGIRHRGFAVIEILQNCPTYNKDTTHEWYQDRVFDTIELADFDNTNIESALEISKDLMERIATGVIYINPDSVPFDQRLENRKGYASELVDEVKSYNHVSQELFSRFI